MAGTGEEGWVGAMAMGAASGMGALVGADCCSNSKHLGLAGWAGVAAKVGVEVVEAVGLPQAAPGLHPQRRFLSALPENTWQWRRRRQH